MTDATRQITFIVNGEHTYICTYEKYSVIDLFAQSYGKETLNEYNKLFMGNEPYSETLTHDHLLHLFTCFLFGAMKSALSE